ncbi:MAG: hypothetical protein NTY35_03410 [Planctomycetota bacterium]|nr:hypothetical protein [Planctomycetota bacterium]
MSLRTTWIACGALLCSTGCITSSVVDSTGRAVAVPDTKLVWSPARPEDLRGLYESVSIEGEVAASLWKIEYVFGADGSYSGAALVLGADNPQFQTLSGRWTLDNGILDLGEGQTARASSAADHLKLENEGGVAILRRAAVQ